MFCRTIRWLVLILVRQHDEHADSSLYSASRLLGELRKVTPHFHFGALLASIIAFSVTVGAAPVSAASINVSPNSGGFGTTFTVYADGFQPNGIVDTWVTRADFKNIPLGTIRANSAGQVQFGVTPQFGWPAGEYIAVAHARAGGLEMFVKFGFNAPPPPNGQNSGGTIPAAAAGMSIQPASGDYNTTFAVTAGGFNGGEPVSVWLVASNFWTFAAGTLNADNSGAIRVSGNVPSTFPAGKYTAYARGQYSGHQYSAAFTIVAPTFTNWKGEYFNNQSLSGNPVLVRNDTAINFNWGLGSPDPAVSSDHFSVRWTRSQFFNAGTYQFTATTDDGMRVWVGDTLLIDEWFDQPATTYNAFITLSAGTYPLRVEYYDDTQSAVAQVSWTTSATTLSSWTGRYYNNTSLSGSPVLVRTDASLNFDWGGGSPGPGVSGTNWSAQWDSSQFAPYTGNYAIDVTSDDGVRVWVDGNLVIDAWHDQPPTFYSALGSLNIGWHSVHVEYYQHNGGSTLRLQFIPS